MKTIQKVPARKALKAIEYHLANPALTRDIMVKLIKGSLLDFEHAVANDAQRYARPLSDARYTLAKEETGDVLYYISQLRMRLPCETYGEITAGTAFTYLGFRLIKRKGGVEFDGAEGTLWPHLQANCPIISDARS